MIDGRTVDATYLQAAPVPLNVTGLAMRFGTNAGGLPIGLQIVGAWQAEVTILRVASMLEGISAVRDLRPAFEENYCRTQRDDDGKRAR